MSSPEQGLAPGKNMSWSQMIRNRLHRYRVLLGRYWWVVALTTSTAVCAGAWYVSTSPQSFISSASLSARIENTSVPVGNEANGSAIQGQISDFLDAQKEIVKSPAVAKLASDRLQAQYPDMPLSPVKFDVVTRSASILFLTATGRDSEYTQRWLQAIVDAYLQKRDDMNKDVAGKVLNQAKVEITRLEGALKIDDDDMNRYQREHNIVFDKGETNGESELSALRNKLSALQSEYNSLLIMTPEQGLERSSSPQAQAQLENSSAESEYRAVQLAIARCNNDLADLSRDMRPTHPKIIALTNEIKRQQSARADLLAQNAKRIANKRELNASLIKQVTEQIAEAEKRAISTGLLRVEFNTLADRKARDLKSYNDMQTTLINGAFRAKAEPESVSVLDQPSAAAPAPSVWLKMMAMALLVGLGVGVGILALIDRMDDTMGTINDFQLYFSEYVVGQIPRDGSKDATELLAPDDERHQLVESFRNLRSTLLYMPLEGERPKTLLITSAIPNEGKSTVSSNLALVMAFAGMKTLLIDCDLRRGAIHKAFDLPRSPGLTDVLGANGVNYKLAIKESGVENLHILPRGRNVPQPSEYLLHRSTDALIKELYPLYDFIIFDSSPILAADDTASLAPKIDATLFVCRLSFTSAKMTRKSLEVLYKRQANIPGVILNQVDTSSPEFVYYQYSEYYHAMQPEEENATPNKVRGRKPVKSAPSESVKIS